LPQSHEDSKKKLGLVKLSDMLLKLISKKFLIIFLSRALIKSVFSDTNLLF